VKQETLAELGPLASWALLARMGPMARKEAQVFQVPLDLLASLDLGGSLVLTEALALLEARVLLEHPEEWE